MRLVSFAKKFYRPDSKRNRRLPLSMVRVQRGSGETAGYSVEGRSDHRGNLRRSDRVISTGPIFSPETVSRHIPSHASYYRRLDTDPAFAAEMSERQARIGQWP